MYVKFDLRAPSQEEQELAEVEEELDGLQSAGSIEDRVQPECTKLLPLPTLGSGGNLAEVVALKAVLAEPPVPLVLQLLFVPVIDNTATTSGEKYKSWTENANTVALPPESMLWFRDNYLPNHEDCSPIFAPDEAFKKAPKTWLTVMELDILRDEALAYGEKLQKAGVEVDVKYYKGIPHPTHIMDGV
ncbi:hypothetical protein WOLCODRAFT_155577 [Wolfiporia cocos MD-104 SS10]|uniref:Alpha/beta hydrolase fold-3 domain-containing protein n=1 Tax=Wolfiporia cocos (strain MD-104) TaxID=742152 RepID=A0A2H3IYW7_WOLCO|nr:hypothetical protein WOLCODRAFT_155577 [Wolfiporia cocos MD-104 SS10]